MTEIDFTDDDLRAALRARRAALDMTIDQLAARSGIPARSLKRYLHGDTGLYFGTVHALAKGLETSLDEITVSAQGFAREKDRTGSVD